MMLCQDCGKSFSRPATHWAQADECTHPPLSDYQLEVATGLLMGDGAIGDDYKNPKLRACMETEEYIKYLTEVFGDFSNEVYEGDYYEWSSMSHPDLKPLANWYTDEGKVWPDDIDLTPTVLKHLYVCDGHWANSDSSNYIVISMWNERNEQEKVNEMFQKAGLPAPSNYHIYDNGGIEHSCNAEWTKDDSRKLWEYMGDPLPGFEYKWPEDLR